MNCMNCNFELTDDKKCVNDDCIFDTQAEALVSTKLFCDTHFVAAAYINKKYVCTYFVVEDQVPEQLRDVKNICSKSELKSVFESMIKKVENLKMLS